MNPLTNLGLFAKRKRGEVEEKCAEWVANGGYVILDGERRFIKSQRALGRVLHAALGTGRTTTDRYVKQYRQTFELMEAAAKVKTLTTPTAAPVEATAASSPINPQTIAPSTAPTPSPVIDADQSFEIELPPARPDVDAHLMSAMWEQMQSRQGKPVYDNQRGRRPNVIVVPNCLKSL